MYLRGQLERNYGEYVLENERNLRQTQLCPEQVIVEFTQVFIRVVVPRARVTVQQCRSFDELPTVLASLALERVVSVAYGLFVELEQLTKRVNGEVALSVLGVIDDTGR